MSKKYDTPRQLHKRGKLLKRGYWTGAAAVLKCRRSLFVFRYI